jgi:hypothetical protein
MTSKRSIEQRLEELEEHKQGDYPDLSLAELLSSDELEDVDSNDSRSLIRVDGDVYDGTPLEETMLEQFGATALPEPLSAEEKRELVDHFEQDLSAFQAGGGR